MSPTAAALAYGLGQKRRTRRSLYLTFGAVVHPLTFRFWKWEKVLSKSKPQMEIPIWAADNLDQRVIEWIVEEFKKDQGIDLSQG